GPPGEDDRRDVGTVMEAARHLGELPQARQRQRVGAKAAVEAHDRDAAVTLDLDEGIPAHACPPEAGDRFSRESAPHASAGPRRRAHAAPARVSPRRSGVRPAGATIRPGSGVWRNVTSDPILASSTISGPAP